MTGWRARRTSKRQLGPSISSSTEVAALLIDGYAAGIPSAYRVGLVVRAGAHLVLPVRLVYLAGVHLQASTAAGKKGIAMKIVVVGGSGLIGSRLVSKLGDDGHEARDASPKSGVNSLTGEGLADVLDGADVVIDVSNSPSFEADDVMDFFTTSTRNILAEEAAGGVRHHVALSVVGTDRLLESGYFRAKMAQETLIQESSIPYSIVRATQFFEFIANIAGAATEGNAVRLAPVLIQPMAADDVASAVGRVAVGPAVNGVIEVAGPDQFRLDEFIRDDLSARKDLREVITDPDSRYFGAQLGERTLIPEGSAFIGATRFDDWLSRSVAATEER